MRHHRIIWYITASVVLIAAVVLFVRETAEPPGAPMERDALIGAMVEAVQKDPQLRQQPTRDLVRQVGSLAESGRPETAETYFALGLDFCRQGWYRDAEDAYRKAISLRPQWSWPHNGLGIALLSMERYDEAETAFRQAIELDPTWSRARNDLAILLRFQGRLEEARIEATRALELDPDNLSTHNNYGNLLVALDAYDMAEQAYRRAAEIDSTHPVPYYNLACLASLRGRADEAFHWLEKAVRLDPALRNEALKDADLDPLHRDPRFWDVVGRKPKPTS